VIVTLYVLAQLAVLVPMVSVTTPVPPPPSDDQVYSSVRVTVTAFVVVVQSVSRTMHIAGGEPVSVCDAHVVSLGTAVP
jgi:hypothetical protein